LGQRDHLNNKVKEVVPGEVTGYVMPKEFSSCMLLADVYGLVIPVGEELKKVSELLEDY
jgi:hypothetical protein